MTHACMHACVCVCLKGASVRMLYTLHMSDVPVPVAVTGRRRLFFFARRVVQDGQWGHEETCERSSRSSSRSLSLRFGTSILDCVLSVSSNSIDTRAPDYPICVCQFGYQATRARRSQSEMLKTVLLADAFRKYIDRVKRMLFLIGNVSESIACGIELCRAAFVQPCWHTLLLLSLRCPAHASREIVLERIRSTLLTHSSCLWDREPIQFCRCPTYSPETVSLFFDNSEHFVRDSIFRYPIASHMYTCACFSYVYI